MYRYDFSKTAEEGGLEPLWLSKALAGIPTLLANLAAYEKELAEIIQVMNIKGEAYRSAWVVSKKFQHGLRGIERQLKQLASDIKGYEKSIDQSANVVVSTLLIEDYEESDVSGSAEVLRSTAAKLDRDLGSIIEQWEAMDFSDLFGDIVEQKSSKRIVALSKLHDEISKQNYDLDLETADFEEGLLENFVAVCQDLRDKNPLPEESEEETSQGGDES